jgi:DNA polymerase III subunit gamma/tau
MSQALYRKWRPQTWEAVVGQPHVISTLRNALAAGRVAHAYLFAGPRGTGKTTTARLLAKAVNCLEADLAKRPCGACDFCLAVNQGRFLDLIEIDAASNTSVEDVRDLRDKINFAPNQGRYKVYIVDEVHMLSTAAFNALLKTLEEPPSHAIFILATTEVHKIPATVLSRCQRHEFRRIPVGDIVDQLKKMAEEEDIRVDEEALTLIARQSTGAMRDAISLLDQLASTGQVITLESAQAVLGTAASQAVLEVVNALVNQQADTGLETIHAALDAGSDPRQFARQIVDYLRDLLLIRMGSSSQVDATAEVRAQMDRVRAAGGRMLSGGIVAYPRHIGRPDTVILFAGDAAAFAEHRETLAALAGDARYLGEDPAVQNAIYDSAFGFYFAALAGFLENLALAEDRGVPVAEFAAAMPGMTALLLDHLQDAARRIESGDFAGDQATVDVHLVGARRRHDTFVAHGLQSRAFDAYLAYCEQASAAGDGGEDIAALFKRIPAPPEA